MANEALTIWNRSLSMIGAPRVSSITEVSSSKELIDDHWVGVRKEFSGLHPWDGCTTVVDLVEDAVVVKPDRWLKAYTLPSGFEQAWRLNDLEEGFGEQPLWEIMALPGESPIVKVVFTDQNAAKLEYSFDPDTDLKLAELNGTATTALVKRLAIDLARPWGKKESDVQLLQREFKEAFSNAVHSNGKQQKRKHDRARPLVDARTQSLRRRR